MTKIHNTLETDLLTYIIVKHEKTLFGVKVLGGDDVEVEVRSWC